MKEGNLKLEIKFKSQVRNRVPTWDANRQTDNTFAEMHVEITVQTGETSVNFDIMARASTFHVS